MKRSKKLILLGIMLSAGVVASGCGEEKQQEVSIFKNQQECVDIGGFTVEQCAKMEADARANSPKFSRREECEQEYGKEMCSGGTDSNGSFWMPALMGFMVGNLLSSGSNGGNVTNNYYTNNQDKDRDTSSGNSKRVNSAVVPGNTAAAGAVVANSGNTAKPTPLIANGLYNNPDKPGSFKSSNGRTVTSNQLGKAVIPRSTATFRGGFNGGGRVVGGGFGG